MSTSDIATYLRDERNTAFILWGLDDVHANACENGLSVTNEQAIEVIEFLEQTKDCEQGITYQHLSCAIEVILER